MKLKLIDLMDYMYYYLSFVHLIMFHIHNQVSSFCLKYISIVDMNVIKDSMQGIDSAVDSFNQKENPAACLFVAKYLISIGEK